MLYKAVVCVEADDVYGAKEILGMALEKAPGNQDRADRGTGARHDQEELI